jgi:hypothetical protein
MAPQGPLLTKEHLGSLARVSCEQPRFLCNRRKQHNYGILVSSFLGAAAAIRGEVSCLGEICWFPGANDVFLGA